LFVTWAPAGLNIIAPTTIPAASRATALPRPFYTKAQIDQRAIGCRGNGSGDAMVKVGSVCIDKYENSIWTARTGGTQITGTIRAT
jgi:hypothetical protein